MASAGEPKTPALAYSLRERRTQDEDRPGRHQHTLPRVEVHARIEPRPGARPRREQHELQRVAVERRHARTRVVDGEVRRGVEHGAAAERGGVDPRRGEGLQAADGAAPGRVLAWAEQ